MLAEKTRSTVELLSDEGERLFLHYALISDRISSEDAEDVNTYGVSISVFSAAEGTLREKAEIRDVCLGFRQASELLECFIKNSVTPVTLPYIIEDFLEG